jgi:putative oxidoreductase
MKKFLVTRLFAPDFAILLLRLGFGSLMAVHGWDKLGDLMNGGKIEFYDIGIGETASLALAVFGELVCAALLTLGLFTRFALVALVITMLVAVFGAHKGEILGDGEHAFLYLVAYVALLITGPGKFSADKALFG